MGGGQTSPADLRPRRGKGVSGPRSTAGGERGPWIGPDMRKRMNRDMEINGEIVNDKVRYADLNLSPELMRAIDKKGYVQATPVQAGAIPYFMEWKDVIAKAPTGTGKTFAFGIPMVEHADPQGTEALTQHCQDGDGQPLGVKGPAAQGDHDAQDSGDRVGNQGHGEAGEEVGEEQPFPPDRQGVHQPHAAGVV